MKTVLSVLILTMLATIIYLVVDRQSVPGGQTTEPKPTADLRLPTSNSRKGVPFLVNQLIDASKHLSEQIEAIRELPGDLTEGEYAALFDLLHQSSPSGVRPTTWTTLQNEIMEVLRSSKFDWPGYAPAISELLLNKEADPIMRDYAAQHLVLYLGDNAGNLSQEQLDNSLGALIAVLEGEREARHQVVGTTLMALCELNTRRPQLLEPHRPALAQTITGLLLSERGVSMSNQIAAIQAAGRLDIQVVLPAIRNIASGNAEGISLSTSDFSNLQLSSVAALGYFADEQDRAFLEKLAGSQSRLRFAAQTALKKFAD